jgi:hypothetical protein
MFNVSVQFNQSEIANLILKEGKLSIPVTDPEDVVIPPGVDLFYTHNFLDGPINALFDFSGNPIPADFFAAGSQPFAGTVALTGSPINPERWGNADTVIKRNATAILPVDSSQVIPVEMIGLSLRSESPIAIMYDGHQELWDVNVSLSPMAASTGQLTIDRGDAPGGTFAVSLQVHPRLVFVRATDNHQKTLDSLAPPSGQQPWAPLLSTLTGVSWSTTLTDLRLIHSDTSPNFFPDDIYIEGNEYAQHFLSPALPDENVLIWKVCVPHGNGVGELCRRVFDGDVIGRYNSVKKLRVEFQKPLDENTVSTASITIQSELAAALSGLESVQVIDNGYTMVILLSSPLPNQNLYRFTLSAAIRYTDGDSISGNTGMMLGVLTGDINQSGAVNSGDMGLLLINRDVPVNDVSAFLDVNRDGKINVGDVVMLKYHTGTKLPALINLGRN